MSLYGSKSLTSHSTDDNYIIYDDDEFKHL